MTTHILWLGFPPAWAGCLAHPLHYRAPLIGATYPAAHLHSPGALGPRDHNLPQPHPPEKTELREAWGSLAGVPLPRTSMRMLLSMPLATNLSSAPCRLAGTERIVTVCRVPSRRITYTLLAFRDCPFRNHSPTEAKVRSTEKVTSLPSTASTAFRGVFTAS